MKNSSPKTETPYSTLARLCSCIEHYIYLALATGPTFYFHISKGHVTWIIKKVNRISTHCGVANESVSAHLLEVTWLECGPAGLWWSLYSLESWPVSWLVIWKSHKTHYKNDWHPQLLHPKQQKVHPKVKRHLFCFAPLTGLRKSLSPIYYINWLLSLWIFVYVSSFTILSAMYSFGCWPSEFCVR